MKIALIALSVRGPMGHYLDALITPLSDKVDVSKVAKEYEEKQGLVSRRLGLEKYLVEMNAALKKHSAWNFAFSSELKTIKKYQTGLVDKTTVIRYNKDIISYAEIFGGEYSVTYNSLVDK